MVIIIFCTYNEDVWQKTNYVNHKIIEQTKDKIKLAKRKEKDNKELNSTNEVIKPQQNKKLKLVYKTIK